MTISFSKPMVIVKNLTALKNETFEYEE